MSPYSPASACVCGMALGLKASLKMCMKRHLCMCARHPPVHLLLCLCCNTQGIQMFMPHATTLISQIIREGCLAICRHQLTSIMLPLSCHVHEHCLWAVCLAVRAQRLHRLPVNGAPVHLLHCSLRFERRHQSSNLVGMLYDRPEFGSEMPLP